MTLIVSLRIPDGIVLAGDSLSTMMSNIDIEGELDVICPHCKHEHKVGPVPVGHLNLPSATYSFAQKVFPFLGEFGIGVFGHGQLMGKTVYFIMRELERELQPKKDELQLCVSQVAELIGERTLPLVRKHVTDIDKAADDWYAVGFQVVGYDEQEAKTITLYIGKTVRVDKSTGSGCTWSGQGHVVSALWQLYKQRPDDQAPYSLFSLQDAIAYAEFLIGTTAAYQKFSRSIPQVGGDIDIALITPFDKFKWIRQKPLYRDNGGRSNG